ncbi:MAG: hypothetical protein IPH49_06910 [Ignavibacteria bacterium]|nr:hypothetical protein [Ignavibacteria bacterium]
MATRSTFLTDELNDYITARFSSETDELRLLNSEALAEGIPAISISPEQINFLQIMLRSINARTVLEIGSLAGYSSIAMSSALPPDGRLYACEFLSAHAQFIRRKVSELGLSNTITVLEGLPWRPLLNSLPSRTSFSMQCSSMPTSRSTAHI